MDANLAGFVALGVLIVGLFAWLRERVARIEGFLEAVFMRRDLTPLPEPPPSGGPPGTSETA